MSETSVVDKGNNSFGKKRILIVEDNAIDRKLYKKQLEKYYSIDFAVNGAEAIRKQAKQQYDLIIMDECMPLKSGVDTTRFIRKYNPNIPIFGISATFGDSTAVREARTVYEEVVAKPYDISRLLNLIKRHI